MIRHPLSQSQLGVALECLIKPHSSQYNTAYAIPLPADIDVERLQRALLHVVAHRQMLHLRLEMDDKGELHQWIDPSLQISVPILTMSEEERENFERGDFAHPFDILSGEPLIRLAIVCTPVHRLLYISNSHVASDTTTCITNLLQRDLPAAYAGEALTADNDKQFLVAQEEVSLWGTETYQSAETSYREQFRECSFTDLSDIESHTLAHVALHTQIIPRSTLEVSCQQMGITPNQLLMSVFALVAARLSRQEDISFVQLRHGRTPETMDAYGMFVHNVPMRLQVTGNASIRSLADDIRQQNQCYKSRKLYPFTHFSRHIMSASTPPLLYNFIGEKSRMAACIDGQWCPARTLMPEYSDETLSCYVYTHDEAYELLIAGSLARYTDRTLTNFAQAMHCVVEQLLHQPEISIHDLSLTFAEEQQTLLSLGQGLLMPYDEQATFLSLFQRQARRTPDYIAVVAEDGSYTYRQLEEASDQLAARLKDCGRHIAIHMSRSRQFLTAVLACHKVGAAYVPIDDEAPDTRVQYILQDSQASALITESGVTLLSAQAQEKEGAYIIYTSGSTGHPKGVVISQRALSHFVQFIAHEWRLTSQSRILCHSSFAFDASVEDLFPVLTVGGTVYLAPSDIRRDIALLHDYICQNHITGGCFTTLFGQMLLQQYPQLPMDYVVLGGERMTEAPPTRCRLINTYGPTEFTVDATFYELQPGRTYTQIPIGRPLHNQLAFVVDAYGHLLPRGSVGELCLAGPQLMDSYWKRPELTAKKIVPSSAPSTCSKDVKMLRTGDLVRWNEEGELEFVGRIDKQIKLRGYRIELGEVEQALQQHPQVEQAIIRIFEEKRLAAYVVLRHKNVMAAQLRDWLKERLPEYMIPTHWATINHIPLTINGKLDERALPPAMPILTQSEEETVQSTLEADLLFLLRKFMLKELGHDEVTVHSDLLQLGLSSLDLVQFCALSRDFLGITTSDIYTYRTIHRISHQRRVPHARWLTPDDPNKPLLIIQAGVMSIRPMSQPFIDSYNNEFSVFCFDNIIEKFFSTHSRDWQLQDILDWLIDELPPFDPERPVLMTGFCMGGELALLQAAEYIRRFPARAKPRVVTYDSFYHRDEKYDPRSFDHLSVIDAMKHKYRLVNRLCSILPPMDYDGPALHAICTIAINERVPDFIASDKDIVDQPYIDQNIAAWRSAHPEQEILLLPTTHTKLHTVSAPLLRQIRETVREKLNI